MVSRLPYLVSEATEMIRNIGQVDLDTGEILEGCIAWTPARPQINENFFMAFQEAFEALAKDREITGESRRVLDFMFSRLDFENFIHVSQREIGENLGIKEAHISRAVKLLVKKEIILEGPKAGKSKCFRLNPTYGWKGKVHNLRNERRKLELVANNEAKAKTPSE